MSAAFRNAHRRFAACLGMVAACIGATSASAAASEAQSPGPQSPGYSAIRFSSVIDLIGEEITSPTGDKLGFIGDVAIRLPGWSADYLEVIPVEGRVTWLPVQALKETRRARELVVDLTQADMTARASSSAGASSPLEQGALRASRVLSATVEDRDGRPVGDVDGMLLDRQRGAIRYVVVRFPPGTLAQNELLQFRPDRLGVTTKDGLVTVSLDVGAAELKGIAGYSPGEWQDLNSPQYWLRRR